MVWGARLPKAEQLFKRALGLQTLALLFYRLVLVVLVVSLLSFLALDRSLIPALVDFFGDYAGFVLGFFGDTKTLEVVGKAYLNSLILMASAITVGVSGGLLLGVFAGLQRGSAVSSLLSVVSFVGTLTPSFLLAILILLLFVQYIHPLTDVRFVLIGTGVDVFDPRRLLAPVLVLAVRPLAQMAQLSSAAVEDALRGDYVRTAYAKGLLPRMVLLRHVLPNVAAPLLTGLNSTFFYSLSSMLVVEWLFVWRGLGFKLLEAVDGHDAVRASYILAAIAVTVVILNTVVKAVIRRVDPRSAEQEVAIS